MPAAGEGQRAPKGWKSTKWGDQHNYQCQHCPRATLDRDAIPGIMAACRKCNGSAANRITESTRAAGDTTEQTQ